MKILTLNPISTSAITENLQVVGAADGASAQNDLTKTSVGTINNPYGHVDSVHVENLAQFFTSYTQLSLPTLGVTPQKYGTSRFFSPYYGQYYAFINDTTNVSGADEVVILEGSNGYSPDLLLSSYTTMNETLPVVGAGVIPLSSPSPSDVFPPSADPLPATIGNENYPTVVVNAPWEDAPLSTAQRIISDYYVASNVSSIRPKDNFGGGTTTTASGSNIVSVFSNTGIVVGMPISGAYVPSGTTVTATTNVATLTGVTATPSAGTLTYGVSGYSASASFSNGDAISVTSATPSFYNIPTSLNYTATGVTSTSFTTTDPNFQPISGITANGNQIIFTTASAHGYSVGQSILTDGTGVSAFNFPSTPQLITAVSTYTFTISSTATGSYTSGGNATLYGTWVASNAIATDSNQIVMSNNATGSSGVSFPNNVVTFANGDAGSLSVGQVIVNRYSLQVGVISSVDSSGNFVTLTGAAAISLNNENAHICTLMSNIDTTNSGANQNTMYDSYSNSITVLSNTAQVYGASAGQTTTGWTAGVSGTTAIYQTASGTFNNYVAGQQVTITGFANTSFNGTFYVSIGTNYTFTVANSTATGTTTGTGTVQATGTTYYGYNQFYSGQNVSVTGFSGTATAFNASGTVIAQNSNLFQIASSLTATATANATATVSTSNWMVPTLTTATLTSASSTGSSTSTGSVTYTVSGTNPFSVGEIVSITGFSSTAYNLTLATVASATTSTFSISTNSIASAGNATGTGTATLNPAIYDAQGVFIGYSKSNQAGGTYGTIINNPSVTFSIQSNPNNVSASNNNNTGSGTGWNNYNQTLNEIVAGQYVFPVQTYNPFYTTTSPAFNALNYDNNIAGILPGMWFAGLYNNSTQIIPPCLINYVDYTNQTITLSASAVANLSNNTAQQPALFCVATTNTASSTLYNRVVTGSNAYYVTATANITSSGNSATASTASAHGLSVGSPITITGASVTAQNGTFAVYSVPSPTSFVYLPQVSSTGTSAGATYTSCGLDEASNAFSLVSATSNGTSVTFTTAGGTFNIGQYVTITGCLPIDYNVANVPVTATGTNTFTVTMPNVVSDAFNTNSLAPQAYSTMSVMPYSNDFADSTTFTRGLVSGSNIPANTVISLNTVATANGTQYVSLGAGTGSYNINVGDFVYGTGIPLGTQIAYLGYTTPSAFNTATVSASAGTVTLVGTAGWHNSSAGQTVSVTSATSNATANPNAYNLSDAYVQSVTTTNVVLVDPTVVKITSGSTTGTTGNYSFVYVTPAHNYQSGDIVTVSNFSSTAYNKSNATITGVTPTSFTVGPFSASAASATATAYATQVVGTVTAGNGGYVGTDQIVQLTNNAASGTISNFTIYNESSYNTNYNNAATNYNDNGYALLSQAATGISPNTPVAFEVVTPAVIGNTSYNTIIVGGGGYSLNENSNGNILFNSSPAVWKNKAYLSTTNNNKFLSNIINVPSFYTPLQLINTQSTPVTTITQGSTSSVINVSNASALTVGNTYMIQGFVITVISINALSNTATVSPPFTSGSPLVLSSTPYANGDAVNNNIYNYESAFSQGSFINSTDYASTGAGAISVSSPITRYHQQGMYLGSYAIGNRYFGSQTNQDFEQIYITPPVLGSHVGTTLNQPISANLDTQFIVNPATTTFNTYTDTFGHTVQNKNFIDLTLGAVGGQAVRTNYVVIVGSGATQEAVLISGQYQTTDNSDVTRSGSGPVSWQLADGQSFQYNHLAGEPVVTPNVNLSQMVITGNVVYSITAIAPSTPSAGYVQYTTNSPHGLSAGNPVFITGCTPTSYNTPSGGATVVSTTPYTFVIANSATSSATVLGTLASENVYINSGLQSLEVGQPIYSLYGNIPAGTTITSIAPAGTGSTQGQITISNLPIATNTAQASITGVAPDPTGTLAVYTANNNFSAGQQVSIAMTGTATAASQALAFVLSATPSSFTTSGITPNPFSPSQISKIVTNANNLVITSASYYANSQTIIYTYKLPFTPGVALVSGDTVTVGGYTGTTNSKFNVTNAVLFSPTVGSATGTFTVRVNYISSSNFTITQSATANAKKSTSVAYYVPSPTTTLTAGETVQVSGITVAGYNTTFNITSTATGGYITYNSTQTSLGNVNSTPTGQLSISSLSTASGNATSVNEPLGTGFANTHSAYTPVLGGADFGTVSSLGYNASPSVIGSNPSKTENAVVEMHSTFNQPWLTAGTTGNANISTTLAQTASAGSTSLILASNENFPVAYPTLTQTGVNFLPPKLGRLAGSVVANSTTIPFVINGELPGAFPYSVTLGSETLVVGSLGQNSMTLSTGASGTYNCLLGYSFSGSTTASSASITNITSTAFNYLSVGQSVQCAGFPSGTTISTITASANTITLSATGQYTGTYPLTLATVNSHTDLTPVHLTAMPSNVQYTALDVPYFYLLQNLSIGATYTSLTTTPVPCAIPAGTTLYIQSGNYSQALTVATAISAGATTISVNSFVANYGYLATVGSAGVITSSGSTISVGLGTSLSYGQTVVMAQSGNYQQLIVAKPVSVNNLNVTFQPFYVTYNFTSSANVFAPYAISLDTGNTLETVYPVTIPASQSADGYSDPYLVNLLSPLTYDHSAGTVFQYYSWPSNPALGDVTYRPDLGNFYMYDGSIWRTSRVLGVQGVYGLLGAANG